MRLEPVVLEVSPTQETFVPFEISTIEMPAGWYQLECDVVIDGEPRSYRPGDRFLMPWPRAAVRRGSVSIGAKVASVALETLECLGDSIRLSFAADAEPSTSRCWSTAGRTPCWRRNSTRRRDAGA